MSMRTYKFIQCMNSYLVKTHSGKILQDRILLILLPLRVYTVCPGAPLTGEGEVGYKGFFGV